MDASSVNRIATGHVTQMYTAAHWLKWHLPWFSWNPPPSLRLKESFRLKGENLFLEPHSKWYQRVRVSLPLKSCSKQFKLLLACDAYLSRVLWSHQSVPAACLQIRSVLSSQTTVLKYPHLLFQTLENIQSFGSIFPPSSLQTQFLPFLSLMASVN